ncbi:MAG: glucose-1-phosphate adenylyltransferase [Candidatus Schekmanbacteria bacterium]|nr:glucose-1-phosphate adenylyltransferase [Candidatus Schekmanbacteria bacterium]
MRKTLAIIMAGGEGKRLYPLTRDRAKPAVPFGGIYRLIDFTLSNCVNSNLRKILILPQYKCLSLDRHMRLGWHIFNSELGEFITSLHPQQRIGDKWYQGTADAIYQNFYTIHAEKPDHILILSGDHVYKMNYADMLQYHHERNAQLTIASIEIPRKQGSHFGIFEVDEKYHILDFTEKPADPKPLPFNKDYCFASMGIYIFNTETLSDVLQDDALRTTEHDFGKNIIPAMIKHNYRVYAYNFKDENKNEAKYWRDVGTIDSYWEANMDLVSVSPVFNLYDQNWPIRTYQGQYPPSKTVFAQEDESVEEPRRMGVALDSVISHGCIISGGRVQNSVLSPDVRINSYSFVYKSVIFEEVEIGRHAMIKNAIIDKEVRIPPGTKIGFDLEEDSKKYTVSEGGIVVIPKGMKIEP